MAVLLLSVIAVLCEFFNVLAVQPGCGIQEILHTRIVGGENALPGSWPWQVSIVYLYKSAPPGHVCGGTLITDEWVITAAHCFGSSKSKGRYKLYLGQHDLKTPSKQEKIFDISELIMHPQYNKRNNDYDIALVRLEGKATFTDYIKPACLPGKNTHFSIRKMCYITGWGLLEENAAGPTILQQARVPLIARKKCQAAYDNLGYEVTPRMLCAGYKKGGIDACQGDSGGPLVCKENIAGAKERWYLWGVVSWGEGCGQEGLYGVFASIKELRPWIDDIVFKGKV